MTSSPTRIVRTLRQAPPVSSRARKRRDDSGLTTLEWLLIVAAVAGLAALAVVLVQNVVGDTSEQIAGASARRTAATIAADEIMQDAQRNASDQPGGAKTLDDWQSHYRSRCDRLEITYGDAGIQTHARFEYKEKTPSGSRSDTVTAAEITIYSPTGGTPAANAFDANGLSIHTITPTATAGAAIAHCVIGDA